MLNNKLDDILKQVEKTARYIGGEWNSIIKDKEKVDVRFAFCFPDLYEIGMSHLGMKILYHGINAKSNYWCERVFAPAGVTSVSVFASVRVIQALLPLQLSRS